MALSKKQQDDKYKSYLDRFGDAKNWAEKLSWSEDKLILTISSGALILSVTFINTTITSHDLQHISYLKWSWVFFVATIVLNLLSVWLSLEGTLRYAEKLNEWLNKDELSLPKNENCYNDIAAWSSQISHITLIIGIILITCFAWFNI